MLLTGSYDQYGIAQQFAISRVCYVSEWMLFESNKFSGMAVKEGLSCLVSGIVFSLMSHCGSLQQQSMYNVTTNQLYRAAAFDNTGHKTSTTPSVIFLLLVRMQGKKLLSSSVILEAQLAWNYQVLLCQCKCS